MTARYVGEILRHDRQSDTFAGQYRLVEQVGRNEWVTEEVAPDDETVNEILEYAIAVDERGATAWCFAADPVTGERTHDAEIAERMARVGERSTVRFVSHEQWAQAF
jgi:hypothetical protein